MRHDSIRDRGLRARCRPSNILTILAAAFVAACADDATAPLQSERTDLAPAFSAGGHDREDGEYIVVLRELPQGRDRDDIERLARFEGASPRYVYTAALQGFAANLNRGQIENSNACNRSPASAASAFTTTASTKTDVKAPYSNFGPAWMRTLQARPSDPLGSAPARLKPRRSVERPWRGGARAHRGALSPARRRQRALSSQNPLGRAPAQRFAAPAARCAVR